MDHELDVALREIRARISQIDPLLVRLVNFATRSSAHFQYGLAVRLGGVTVSGIPASSVTTAEILDKQTLRFIQSMQAVDVSAGGDGGKWPEIVKSYREIMMFAQEATSDDEIYAKLNEKLDSDEFKNVKCIADLPDDMTDDVLYAFAPPKAFTLTNVVIQRDGGATEEVPNMRINMSAVEAWWVFDLGIPEDSREAFSEILREEES
jgi:hypothetical protein